MNYIKWMRKHCHCCSCGGTMRRVNIVDTDRQAEWDYPTGGNVLTGESGHATALLCDACCETREKVKEVVEFKEVNGKQTVVYHPIEGLKRAKPPKFMCATCENPLTRAGGYGGTGLCGPCATGEAETINEIGVTW